MKLTSLFTAVVAFALLAGGCKSPDEGVSTAAAAAPAAEQDAQAQQAAEEQAALEVKADAAREIAKAEQAQRELAMQQAAEHEREQAALREAAEKAAAEAAANKLAAEKLAADKLAAEAAAKAAAEVAAATAAKESSMTEGDTNVVAEVETTAGTLVLGFLPDVAPGHVKNFVDLARKGFYDGTRFHRVIPGFMIQGGDPLTKDLARSGDWGMGDPGYKIKAEFSDRPHERGTLSMARGPDPDSAGSQFFICHGRAASLDRGYTVFGELLRGYDVLDKIATAPTGNQPHASPGRPPEKSRPLDPVRIVKVTIRPRTASDVKEGS
jgi:peptidyl-prolyl cis-trans isomerase B (cyclophilin B)